MSAQRTIYIAGAGIAGLTLALALAKFGLHVVVLERNAEISQFGAGLQISPNARKILNGLGLDDALRAKSFEPQGIDIYPDGRKSPLQTLTLGSAIAERFGAPYAVMHRADLVEILFGAAKRFANIDIVFGVSDIAVGRALGDLLVTAVEPDGKKRRVKPFAFVGADGVRSKTRTSVIGGPEAQYTGKVAWRALISPRELEPTLDLTRTSLLLGTKFHLVVYPLPHRDAVNLALFTQEPANALDRLDARQPDLKSRGNARLAGILQAVGANWTPWVLSTIETGTWHIDDVGLIGDAAHAMLPFQAQGAAMAIEDAAVLAPLLAASPSASHAFSRFAALRRDRVQRVQEISRQNGRVFHMGWPLALARNGVIRIEGPRGHFKRLDWLYGYEPSRGT